MKINAQIEKRKQQMKEEGQKIENRKNKRINSKQILKTEERERQDNEMEMYKHKSKA